MTNATDVKLKLKPCPFCGEEDSVFELEPCPFCGEKDSIKTDKYIDSIYHNYWVVCGKCGSNSGSKGTIEEAIKVWNTRSSENDDQQIVDADGVPINVGDIVWTPGGDKCFVTKLNATKTVNIIYCDDGRIVTSIYPLSLVHKEPDSLEKIVKDAKKPTTDYWNCGGIECSNCSKFFKGRSPKEQYNTYSCNIAKTLDLLERQRKILEEQDSRK